MLALTGSQGKTGTKDFLAQVLAGRAGPTVATAGNRNNEIGVPLTVLRADPRHPLPRRSRWARAASATSPSSARSRRPTSPPVLNVGTAHIGEFGSREAIAPAKGEIVEALAADGTAVLNADDPLVAAMAPRTAGAGAHLRRRRRRRRAGADVELDDLGRPVLRARVRRRPGAGPRCSRPARTRSPTPRPPPRWRSPPASPLRRRRRRARLAPRSLSPWRMELHERADGLVVVNDAYNANPDSMAAALDALAAIGERGGRRTVAVLGEMLELGDDRAPRSTPRSARTRPRLGIDVAGRRSATAAEAIADGARRTPGWARRRRCPRRAASRRRTGCATMSAARDVVLVKASRGAALEHVADALLLADDAGPAEDRKAGARADEGDPAGRRPRPAVLAARHPVRRSRCFTQLGLRPADPRRRPDQPPHQARHARPWAAS